MLRNELNGPWIIMVVKSPSLRTQPEGKDCVTAMISEAMSINLIGEVRSYNTLKLATTSFLQCSRQLFFFLPGMCILQDEARG